MENKKRPIFIHEIKLPEKDDFSRKFNEVSDYYAKSCDTSLSDEERHLNWNIYCQKKYCLEQGIYVRPDTI